MTRSIYKKFQILALTFSASVLLSAVMRGGTVSKSHSMQCPVAPNGKLYLAPGC
jgi:hypothetical protein